MNDNLEECNLCHDFKPISELIYEDGEFYCEKCRTPAKEEFSPISITARLVAFDSRDKTLEFFVSEMPKARLGEKWMLTRKENYD